MLCPHVSSRHVMHFKPKQVADAQRSGKFSNETLSSKLVVYRITGTYLRDGLLVTQCTVRVEALHSLYQQVKH